MQKIKMKRYLAMLLVILQVMTLASFDLFNTSIEAQALSASTFNYSGGQQTFTVPYTGTYRIEVYGAKGGGVSGISGANGGYTKGDIFLNAGDKLYIYNGGMPSGSSGGYNGGGSGGSGSNSNSGAGGGGGTDVRLNGTNLSNRIIVAGGGGGAGGNGQGGGSSINSGTGGVPGHAQANGSKGTSTEDVSGHGGLGASSSSGGSGGSPTSGSSSSNDRTYYPAGGGGGGGGYYGGGGGAGASIKGGGNNRTGSYGSSGSLGSGGNGGNGASYGSAYYSGSGGGGGGGSSYANSSFTNVSYNHNASTSNGKTIITPLNQQPTTPSSFTISGNPSDVKNAKPYTFTWGPSSDSDGTISNYRLTKSVNGGSEVVLNDSIPVGTSYTLSSINTGSSAGTIVFKLYARDNGGALSNSASITKNLIIDDTAPNVAISIPSGYSKTTLDVGFNVTDENNIAQFKIMSNANSVMFDSGSINVASSYSKTFTFSSNGTYKYYVKDNYGNEKTISFVINTIDTVNPSINLSLSNSGFTKNNINLVVANSDTLSGVKVVKVTDKSGSIFTTNVPSASKSNYTFNHLVTKNGLFTVVSEDYAGNKTTKTLNVTNIDKLAPSFTYSLSNTNKTNQPVIVTVDATDASANGDYANSGILDIENLNATDSKIVSGSISEVGSRYTFTVSQSGTWNFRITDNAGNTYDGVVTVSNIKTTPPVITVNPYTLTASQGSIGVSLISDYKTFIASSGVSILNDGKRAEYTFTENGSKLFEVTDEWGNNNSKIVTVTNIDNFDPTIDITRDIQDNVFTNNNYNITAVFKDVNGGSNKNLGIQKIEMPDGTSTTFDDYEDIVIGGGTKTENVTKIFNVTQNGTYTFKVTDNSGRVVTKSVTVTNINKIPPVITYTQSETAPTNGDVTVVATTKDFNGNIIKTETETFEQNTNSSGFTFNATDKWGNNATPLVVHINNIDKFKPTISGSFVGVDDLNDLTNKPFDIFVQVSDITNSLNGYNSKVKNITLPDGTVQPINNLTGSITYNIPNNGVYTFVVEDNAGNTETLSYTVKNINYVLPVLSVAEYTTTPTNEDVVVVLYSDVYDDPHFTSASGSFIIQDGVSVTNEGLRMVYTFKENESKTFSFKDDWGNIVTETITITNIEKSAPVITISDYTTDLTDSDITVSATTSSGTLNATSHTFTSNGSFTFVATDNFGNSSIKTVVIDNIDKVLPNIVVQPYNTELTNQSVTVSVLVNKGTLNASSHIFTDNGSFTFTVTDALGRTDSETVTITNINKENPKITIDEVYYIDDSSNKVYFDRISGNDFNLTQINKDIIVVASTDKGSLNFNSFTFENNGEVLFIAEDSHGNISQERFIVNNINKIGPTISFNEYNTSFTNEDVQVIVSIDSGSFDAISTSDNYNVVGTDTQKIITFSSNDIITLVARDSSSNVTKKVLNITNINKSQPIITIGSYPTEPYNDDIDVIASAVDGLGNDVSNALNETVHKFTENGVFVFEVTDKWGNTVSKSVEITNILKVPPTITVEPFNTDATVDAVTVNVTVMDGDTFDSTGTTTDSYTFVENGSHTFYATSRSGMKSEKTVTINHIDKVGPTLSYTVSEHLPTSDDVVLTVRAIDENGVSWIKKSEDIDVTNSFQYVLNVSENATFTFMSADDLGNESSLEISILNIDKTAPEIELSSYTTEPTAFDILVEATSDGDLNAESHLFTENGEFTFIATDSVGNKTEKTVVINNINKAIPQITVHPYVTELTNETVYVTAVTNAGKFANGLETLVYAFEENGSYTFVARTDAGVQSTVKIDIDNINKIAPTINVSSYPTEMTANDITINASAVDVEGTSLELNKSSHTFSKNGSFVFIASDKWGNTTELKILIDNINKDAPVITINPFNATTVTNEDVSVTATLNKGTFVDNGLTEITKTFSENGLYEFVAEDEFGNRTVKKVIISNIDKISPIITLNDYTTEPTNFGINVEATTNEGTLNVSNHYFDSNGEFTFVAIDDAGNRTEKIVTITNIRKVVPIITLDEYELNYTNESIVVTARTDIGLFQNGENVMSHTFDENGMFTFIAEDEFGNKSDMTVNITNINKSLPIITVTQDNYDESTDKVIVTATADKGVFEGSQDVHEVVEFTNNGSYTFKVTDIYGNVAVKTVTITSINADTTAPVITIQFFETEWTNEDVLVEAKVDKGTLNENIHTFTENGVFIFEATDKWGNVAEKAVTVSHIDKTKPNIPKFLTEIDVTAKLKLIINDDGDTDSGIDKVLYSLNQDDWSTGVNSYHLLDDGTHTIYAKSLDIAGNESDVVSFEYTHTNKQSFDLYESIKNGSKLVSGEKVPEVNLTLAKNIRDEIQISLVTMHTSTQKTFLEKHFVDFKNKINVVEGNDLEEIVDVDKQIVYLLNDLKLNPTNESVLNELYRLIATLTDESSKKYYYGMIDKLVKGKDIDINLPTDENNNGDSENDSDDDEVDKPEEPDYGNDSYTGEFGDYANTIINKIQEEEEVENHKIYEDIDTSKVVAPSKESVEEKKFNDDVEEIKNTIKEDSSTYSDTDVFVINKKDINTSIKGDELSSVLSNELIVALAESNQKEMVLKANTSSTDVSMKIKPIKDGSLKKNIDITIDTSFVDVTIPAQKLAGDKSYEIKTEKIKAKGLTSVSFEIKENSTEINSNQLSGYFKGNVTLTLENKTNKNNVAVYTLDNGKWQKVNSNRNGNLFTITNPDSGIYVIKEFNKVSLDSNVSDDVNLLNDYGILDGVEENIVELNGVSKGDFVTMLVNALQVSGIPEKSFNDIDVDSKYFEAISLAQQYGIINQFGGNFNPNETITKEDAVAWVYNASIAYSVKNEGVSKIPYNTLNQIANSTEVINIDVASKMISLILK